MYRQYCKIFLYIFLAALSIQVARGEDSESNTSENTTEKKLDKDNSKEIVGSSIITEKSKIARNEVHDVPCTCGIFLTSQTRKLSKEPPKGNPVFQQETDNKYMYGPAGVRMCNSKCLEVIMKYLPKSENLICSALEGDCYKEKAHLFVKNHVDKWINTKMSAGREYCCKNNTPYKCN